MKKLKPPVMCEHEIQLVADVVSHVMNGRIGGQHIEWEVWKVPDEPRHITVRINDINFLDWEPLSNMEHTFHVIEKLRRRGWSVIIRAKPYGQGWEVSVFKEDDIAMTIHQSRDGFRQGRDDLRSLSTAVLELARSVAEDGGK